MDPTGSAGAAVECSSSLDEKKARNSSAWRVALLIMIRRSGRLFKTTVFVLTTTPVLTLLIVNSDNVPATSYDTIFKSVGLDTVSFVPESTPVPLLSWPTLGDMIDSGKRLVTFLDNGASASVPYLLDGKPFVFRPCPPLTPRDTEFTNVWETAFNVIDPAFDCNINRTKGDASTQMYIINHFLDKLLFGQPVPDVDKANVTNSASGFGSLGAQVDTCVAQHTRPPTFMLVDVSFVNILGNVTSTNSALVLRIRRRFSL